jgi:hypothetical protein
VELSKPALLPARINVYRMDFVPSAGGAGEVWAWTSIANIGNRRRDSFFIRILVSPALTG